MSPKWFVIARSRGKWFKCNTYPLSRDTAQQKLDLQVKLNKMYVHKIVHKSELDKYDVT